MQDVRTLTLALRTPATCLAALAALRPCSGQAVVEALVELIHEPPSARAATTAIEMLAQSQDAIVVDALRAALRSEHATVRLSALEGIKARPAEPFQHEVRRLLTTDGSWLVRRAAVRTLACSPAEAVSLMVLGVGNDPHWRVRHAWIQTLLATHKDRAERESLVSRLHGADPSVRITGVIEYLRLRWFDAEPVDSGEPEPERPDWWDSDAAVLARNLDKLGPEGRLEQAEQFLPLLMRTEGRVRTPVLDMLRSCEEPGLLARAIALLDEPRTGVGPHVHGLLASLDLDQRDEIVQALLELEEPTPAQTAWALDQADEAVPFAMLRELAQTLLSRRNKIAHEVLEALGRYLARSQAPELAGFLVNAECETQAEALRVALDQKDAHVDPGIVERLLNEKDAHLRGIAARWACRLDLAAAIVRAAGDEAASVRRVVAAGLPEQDPRRIRLRQDPHPHVRAAALDAARAAELVADPRQETSWHVLARAAHLCRVPLWKLAPGEPWRAPPAQEPSGELTPARKQTPAARLFGPDETPVTPLGISGHYGLPVAGFVRAYEAGVNLMFWEPNYQTMTEFVGRLSASSRAGLHLVAGTFEAEGPRIERDVERALRQLRLERLPLFLMFWVQSWRRITADVRATLEKLQAAGKIARFGLSTHSRPLALEAMQAGWNPLMVRHSLAHRGAETEVFPQAVQSGTSILTFNNTCYGRLLGDESPVRAADCYRYTLSQAGVTACWSAPATMEQLEENLTALTEPELPADRLATLLAHGDKVYREDAVFRKLVRSR